MILSEECKAAIKAHALEESPKECCGLLVCLDECIFPVKSKNLAENPKKHFVLDAEAHIKADDLGTIVGFYHSHLSNPEFSDPDRSSSEFHNLPALLYCVESDAFSWYKPQGLEIPLVGRQYVVGYFDCFKLIQDYYKQKLNIEISEMVNPYRFVNNKADHPDNDRERFVFEDHLKANSFYSVDSLREHDIILTRSAKISSAVHGIIYLGDDKILHHPNRRNSLIEPYSAFYKKLTKAIFRHE